MIEPKARTAYSIAMEEEDLESSGTTLVYLKSEAYRYIAHLKRKRCLAMAMWCLTEKVYFHYRYDDWGDIGYDRPYKWKKVVK